MDKLREYDYKEIRLMLINKYHKTYSTNYIRRVLSQKDKRRNALIESVAEDYISIKKEFQDKLHSPNKRPDQSDK